MLSSVFDRVMTPFSWKLDEEKSEAHLHKYYKNTRTGDRKVVRSPVGFQPIDMAWLAQAKNVGIIEGFISSPTTFTERRVLNREELDAEAKRSSKCPVPRDALTSLKPEL